MPAKQAISDKLPSMAPVVIMGRGHSGTRVVTWLCTHLDIQLGTSTGRETADADDLKFTRCIRKMAIPLLGVQSINEINVRSRKKFRRAVTRYYLGLGQPEGLWGWKFPETYLIAPLVFDLFPKVRMLHILRDGRDLAFKDHLTDDPSRSLGKKLLGNIDALNDTHPIQAIKSWAWQVQQLEQFTRSHPNCEVLTISFEELCLHPLETGQKICSYLQVEMTDAARNYLETGINTSKVHQYRDEGSQEEIAAVTAAEEDTLRGLGYLKGSAKA
jgi:hypothetical protein